VIDTSGLQVQATDEGGSIQYIYNPERKVKEINSPSGTTPIEYMMPSLRNYNTTLN